MGNLRQIEQYCNQLLGIEKFDDYCPNGLQVDAGANDVKLVVSGVTASQALIDQAIEWEADLLLVHHGFFWRGESPQLTGIKGRRIRALMQHGVSLLAYHLPLDAHPELGNNRQLGERLGFTSVGPLSENDPLLWATTLDQPLTADELKALLAKALAREPLLLIGGGHKISRLGWCTGAAQGAIEEAAAAGLDAFISGEVSESTTHLARELGLHYFASGHHATERYGIEMLGDHLARHFSLEHRFADVPNPV